MTPEGQSNDTQYAGDPIGPGLFTLLRRTFGTKRGRRALLLVAGVVLVIVISAVGLVVYSSMTHESQSYRDGFSVGGGVYASDSSAQLGADQACEAAQVRGPHHGGLPSGDDANQWRQGCVAAFASAQAGN